MAADRWKEEWTNTKLYLSTFGKADIVYSHLSNTE